MAFQDINFSVFFLGLLFNHHPQHTRGPLKCQIPLTSVVVSHVLVLIFFQVYWSLHCLHHRKDLGRHTNTTTQRCVPLQYGWQGEWGGLSVMVRFSFLLVACDLQVKYSLTDAMQWVET